MLSKMKRICALLMTVFCLAGLWGYSVLERTIEQPFDSVKELASVPIQKSLSHQQKIWAEQTKVHLLTIGPGDDLYAWFGHSALIVTGPSGTKIMYDWGIFDPNQDHFYLNFARGRMYYYVVASEASWRIQDALTEVRDVSLIELNFSNEAKLAIISFLNTYIQGDYRTYLYHFYDDNCATRIRDIIDRATEGEFKIWAEQKQERPSLRNQVMRYMIHDRAVFWILDFLQGPTVDKELNHYDEMFLPLQLEQAVLDFTYSNGTPLAISREILLDTQELAIRFSIDESSRTYTWFYAICGLLVASALLLLGLKRPALKRWVLGLFCIFMGILGSLLLFMMAFSDMDMTYFNENILFANPLLFFASYSILIRKNTQSRMLSLLSIIMIILLLSKLLVPSIMTQDNLRIILLLLPIYLSGARRECLSHGKKRKAF